MTIPPHYDLNEAIAESAPDELGEVFIFDSNKNEGSDTLRAGSIRKYLLSLLNEYPDTKGIKVGWNVGDVFNQTNQYLHDYIAKHGLTIKQTGLAESYGFSGR